MKSLNSTRRDCKEQSNEPWALVIRQRYGSTEALLKSFAERNTAYCDNNLQDAIASDVPPLCRLALAYGNDTAIAIISALIASVIIDFGEEMQAGHPETQRVAQLILTSDRFRVLSMATIMAMFNRLRTGEIETFGKLSPRTILQALQRYIPIASEREYLARNEVRKLRKAKADAEYNATAISWEEYCSLRHINPDQNPLMLYANTQ